MTQKRITRTEDIELLKRGDEVTLFRGFPEEGLNSNARVVEADSNQIGFIVGIRDSERLYAFKYTRGDLRSRAKDTLGNRPNTRDTYQAKIIRVEDPEYEYYKSFLEGTE